MKISPFLVLAGVAPSLFGSQNGLNAVRSAGRDAAVTWTLPAAASRAIRVYVAGESIERRNRFVEAPFTGSGALNERGGGGARNDNEEYGWMVPLRDRLRLRAPDLDLEFVGSDVWANDNDSPYTGTYPSATPEPTSAISGTSIPSWLDQRRGELESRAFCYDLAFASRGGNDFSNNNDAEYKDQLKELVLLLARGSSCRTDPIVVVTGHMPDDQRSGEPPADYVALALHRFVERSRDAVTELAVTNPGVRVRFADQYTPFIQNRPTTAFPSEVWAIDGIPDYAKIAREDDRYHPRRLASIYAGELAADSLDLQEMRALVNGGCAVAIAGPGSVCAGQSATLDAGPGFTSYLWSTGATTRTVTVSPSATTTYTVTVTGAECISASASTDLVVNAAPAAPSVSSPSSAPQGATGLSATVPSRPGSGWHWTITNGSITSGQGTAAITFTAGSAGQVSLSVVETSPAGCASTPGTATTTIVPLPLRLYTLAPCRLVDTRGLTSSAFSPGERRNPPAAPGCGISSTAKALALNVTVAGPTAAGYLTLFPGDAQDPPVTSTINFRTGQVRANNAVVLLGTDGTLGIVNGSPGGTHVIVDVVGHFE